MHWTKRIE